MSRAPASGITLTDRDAAVIKGMLHRGDRQHDIAAWFGVNGGRIAEIATGDRFSNVPMESDNLPPPGPYLSGRATEATRQKLIEMRERLQTLIDDIDNEIDKISSY